MRSPSTSSNGQTRKKMSQPQAQPIHSSVVGSQPHPSPFEASTITIAIPPTPSASTPSQLLAPSKYKEYMDKIDSLHDQMSSTRGLVLAFCEGYGWYLPRFKISGIPKRKPYFCRVTGTSVAIPKNRVLKGYCSYRSATEQSEFIMECFESIRANLEVLLPKSDKASDEILVLWNMFEIYESEVIHKAPIRPYRSSVQQHLAQLEMDLVRIWNIFKSWKE